MRALLLLVPLAGCSVIARQHPCWDYVAHHLKGDVPSDVARQMAWDRGATRVVRGTRAPMGYYWKRGTTDTHDLNHRRQYLQGHELTACPAASAPPVTTPPLDGES
jgi:hypothetical protein